MTNINKFYAVTQSSSLYEAVIGDENNIPYLVKIDAKGKSKLPIGYVISNGTMISIGKSLNLFVPEGGGTSTERQISKVNTRYWGGNTSYIVALFTTKKDAKFCLENHIIKNEAYKNQWKKSTIEVLQAIGNEHPYCSIETNFPKLWLMPPTEWQK